MQYSAKMESSAAVRGLSPIIEQVTIFVTAYSLHVRVWFGRGSGVLWWRVVARAKKRPVTRTGQGRGLFGGFN